MHRIKKRKKLSETKRLQNLEQFVQKCYEEKEKNQELADSSSESHQSYSDTDAADENLYSSIDATIKNSLEELGESESEIDEIINQQEVQEIQDIRAWVVDNNIPHQHVDKLLPILKRRLLPEIPKCAKTLLKCDVKLDNVQEMEAGDGSMGEFIYLGIENELKKRVDVKEHPEDILELIFNIDGFSPFKSSAATVWPILCKVFTECDMYRPFTVAVYAGNGKPKRSKDYLRKFVEEINHLLNSKVNIDGRCFTIQIKYFVCDCPARSFVKDVLGHGAFHACERCRVVGQKINGVTVFLQTDAERRTDASFATFADPQCHTGISPLSTVTPAINMVSQFILDPMHLVYLGCTKRLLEYLLSPSTRAVKLSATLKSELVRRTKSIYKDIPAEFPRKMRSTDHFSKYKAVEFKFFVLYAAPVVFMELLSDDVYEHFMLLTVACRLLCKKFQSIQINEARKYLTDFVDMAPTLYGETFVSLNVHNLIHLCDDIETTKCSMNQISAFSFESYLGSISSVLRSPVNLVSQYYYRMTEKDTFSKKGTINQSEVEILMKKKDSIVKLRYKNYILSTKHPDNTVMLQDKSIVRISNFKIVEDKYYVTIQKYDKKDSIFDKPCDSGSLNIWEVHHLSKRNIQVRLQQVKDKCVHFKLSLSGEEDEKSFVLPLLH